MNIFNYQSNVDKYFYTSCGIISLILWSTSVYCFKKTIDAFGVFSGLGIIQLLSGFIGLILYILTNSKNCLKVNLLQFTKITTESIGISLLFIINLIANGLAYALPPAGEVLFQCSIIGYLWTILLNVLLVFVLDYKIKHKIFFYSGCIFALIGIVISYIGFNFEKINFPKYFLEYYYCYVLAIIAALTWSFYSVFIIKYNKLIKDDHIFFSFLISGTILTSLSFINSNWPKLDDFGGKIDETDDEL